MIRILLLGAALLCASARAASCVPDASTACLAGGQFRVTVSFDDSGARFAPPGAMPASGAALATPLTDDTALFSLHSLDQFDLAVKVLDACVLNDRYWVFAALPTDSGLNLQVEDTSDGSIRSYVNPAGNAGAPITDTAAFACPSAPAGDAGNAAAKTVAALAGGACGHDFCLLGDRFGLDVDFTYGGGSGQGQSVVESADRSALIWMFNASNLEAIASMVDGRSDNGAFWFLASALSNVEIFYTLTDTSSALQNRFHQPMFSALTLLDRGEPLDAGLAPQGAGPGATAAVTLLIDNPHSGSRAFRALLAAPAGATGPRFSCTASSPALCPAASGSGDLDQSGDIPGGGALQYRVEFELPANASAGDSIPVDATVTTLADALSGDRVTPLSTAVPVAQAAPPINGPELVPALDGAGRWLAILLMVGLALFATRRNARG